MSAVRLLSPKINLVKEIADLAGIASSHTDVSATEKTVSGGERNTDIIRRDFSKTIVVFPGKRPAHQLRKEIADRIGSSFIPPQIFSVDLFIDDLYAKHVENNARTIEEMDAVAILFEIHQRMQSEQKIGQNHFSTLERFYPVGVKIFSELEELAMAGITPERLMESLALAPIPTVHSLALLYEPLYSELSARRFITRALKYQYVAHHISKMEFGKYRSIIFAGFFAFTRTEETIIRYFLTLSNVTMLFQNGKGIRATLEALNVDPEVEGEPSEPEHYFHESPDAHGQLIALNRIMAEQYPQPIVRSDEAVIVIPSSENLFPLYHQTLSVYDSNAYNLALGYPLTRTPVYGFLLSLLEVVVSSRNGFVDIPKYLQFLLHPYTKNILLKTRTDVTRLLIHAVEEYCLEHSARVFIPLERIENDPFLLGKTSEKLQHDGVDITGEELRAHLTMIHTKTLRPLMKIRTLSEFAEASIGIIHFINEQSTAHRHPYFRPFVDTALEQLQMLQQSLLSGHSFGSPEHYLMFLKHIMSSAEVPFSGTPLQGLQVLGYLETRGLKFDTVFMIDVNDDVLPGKSQQDVLLPLVLREHLGLSTYRKQERIKAYMFDLLRCGASTVHYFYVNNHQKEPSRFIADLQWREQLQRRSLKPFNTTLLEYAIDLGTHAPQPKAKGEMIAESLRKFKYSSTALDMYLSCGLKFYYRYVLHLREKDVISGDVEQSDVGKVIHRILAEYFAPALDRKLENTDLEIERLRKVIADNFRSFYGSEQFGEQFLTKRQVEKHLREYIEKVQKVQIDASAITIEALESKFETEIEGFTFTGNADRIESRNEKTYILDYKSGYNESNYAIKFKDLDLEKRKSWKDSIGSVQLALYSMLYSAIRNIPAENIVPAYIFLGKKELNEEIEVRLFASPEETKEWYPVLSSIVLSLVREITDATIPFTPTDDIKKDCPGCPYATICGTQWAEKFSLY